MVVASSSQPQHQGGMTTSTSGSSSFSFSNKSDRRRSSSSGPLLRDDSLRAKPETSRNSMSSRAMSHRNSRRRSSIKENENIKLLTINKLQYDKVGVVGRNREIKQLQSCLERLMKVQNRSTSNKHEEEAQQQHCSANESELRRQSHPQQADIKNVDDMEEDTNPIIHPVREKRGDRSRRPSPSKGGAGGGGKQPPMKQRSEPIHNRVLRQLSRPFRSSSRDASEFINTSSLPEDSIQEKIPSSSHNDISQYEDIMDAGPPPKLLQQRSAPYPVPSSEDGKLPLLQAVLQNNNKNTRINKELVFIKGYSGVGKSTLAYTLAKSVNKKTFEDGDCGNMNKNSIFVSGKFDFTNRDEPYSGIAEAFGEMCRTIMILQKDEQQEENKGEGGVATEIGRRILSELGNEIGLLAKLIPELEDIVPHVSLPTSEGGTGVYDSVSGKRTWKYAFCVLTRVLNSFFSPMIILLDDLQWVDVASLELIDFLLSDSLNTNGLMVVGCYRANEVDEMHILTRKVQDLQLKKEKSKFHMTDIEVGNLQPAEVNTVIAALLSVDDKHRTKGLADICFKRTHGNPFFLIKFVSMLEEEDLISFNLGRLTWNWNEKDIVHATVSALNVTDLLQAKMKKLPKKTQLVLQYAACLGSTFTISTLDLIWKNHYPTFGSAFDLLTTKNEKEDSIDFMLASLEDKDFIESVFLGTYRWVHDRIQEAALSLGEAASAEFQFEIGSILYQGLNAKNLEDALFDVVNLINLGKVQRRPDLAELNLRAAEKAKTMSAFQSAAKYVSRGIKLLPEDKWSTQYHSLTLRLYTVGSQVELALGHPEAMEAYSTEVLSRDDTSTLDKLPLYMVKTNKLSMGLRDTINLCLIVLEKLGYKVVWNRSVLPAQALLTLVFTVRKATQIPKESYESSMRVADEKQKAIMILLGRLFYSSFLAKDKWISILSSCGMVQLTMKHGRCPMSGAAFATLGLLTVGVLGDFDSAAKLAETSLVVQKLTRSTYHAAVAVLSAYLFALAWKQPLQNCFSPFWESYIAGMRSGNTEYGMWALSLHDGFLPYVMGKPLDALLSNCSSCVSLMEEVRQKEQRHVMQMLWQVMLNLMGRSSESAKLKGAIFDCDAFVEARTPLVRAFMEMLKSDLLVFFGDFENAARLAIKRGDRFGRAVPGHLLFMQETFHRAVAIYAMARKTNQQKYRKLARRVHKSISKWARSGNPNVQHYDCFLKAEMAALTGKSTDSAEWFYKEAVVLAARTGHLHHAALFNERYADFLLRQVGDKEEAKYRTKEAIRYYKDWGAEAKAIILINSLYQRGDGTR